MVKTPTPYAPQSNDDESSTQNLKQNMGYIAAVIAIALAGYFGWDYFQNQNGSIDTVAADKYVAIEQETDALNLAQDSQTTIDAEQAQKITADIDALVAEHGATVYAWEALLLKARLAADTKDYATAKQALKAALDIELNDAGLHALTQLRYAAALLANDDIDEAMKQATAEVPLAFEPSQQELMGDIYMAKEDTKSAMRAYENAWNLLSKRKEERGVLRLKLEGLGLNPEPIEPELQIVNPAPMSTGDIASATETNATEADATEMTTDDVAIDESDKTEADE